MGVYEDIMESLQELKDRQVDIERSHHMKKSEIIRANYGKLFGAMKEAYEDAVRSDGRIQVGIYLWDDGEIETLTDVQGSNTWLQPRQMEPRALYYVTTVELPCFDIWDFSPDPKPEDEEEAERMKEELIDWYLSEGIGEEIRAKLDVVIEDAVEDEEMEERTA